MSFEPAPLTVRLVRNKYRHMQFSDVRVTHINSPSNFYVRPVCITQNDLNALEVCERPMENNEVKINALAVYYSETVGKLVRGRICKLFSEGEDANCTIHALDYGFLDSFVPFKYLYKPGGDSSIKPLATLCQLARCFPVYGSPWDDEVEGLMKKFIKKSIVKVFVQLMMEDRLVVNLNIKSTMADLGQWLISNHYAVSYHPSDYEVPPPLSYYREYSYNSLDEGNVALVRLQSGTSLNEFYVAKLEDYKQYLTDREQFTSYCNRQKDMFPSQIIKGRAVGYRTTLEDDSIYERAYILEVLNDGDRAVIQLIDWGDKIEVCHTQLKMLDYMKIRDTPSVAVLCSTTETLESNTRLLDNFKQGFEMIVHVRKKGEDFEHSTTVDISRA